jgi:putative peptidoglycan lipid II flippase
MSTPSTLVEASAAEPVPSVSIGTAAGILAAGNVASRVLGLARETVIADLFGATGLVSAYRVASIVPTMIYDLLIGGMISAALVPVFTDYTAPSRRDELARLASVVLTLAGLVLIALVAVLELFAPQLVWVLSAGFDARLQAETVSLVRLILPATLFLGLSGVTTGLLYSLRRFTYPAFVVAVFNASIIVLALLASRRWGIASLAVGVLAGAFLQVALQAPGLRDLRLRPTFDLAHPGLGRIGALYLPVALGLVVSQVGVAIDRNLASHTGTQTIAWMAAATTLIQFPLGLVVAAISLAALPTLAATASIDNREQFRTTLTTALRLVLVLILPATVGLWVLGQPVIRLLFEHGAFTAFDTRQTSLALGFYLIGLPFAAVDQPLIYAYYASKNTRTPVLVGVMAIGVYLVVALALIGRLGMVGLVLANSAQWLSHALVMLWLIRRGDGLHWAALGRSATIALAGSLAMGVATWGVLVALGRAIDPAGRTGELLLVSAGGVTGVVIYLVVLARLGASELQMLWDVVARRLRRVDEAAARKV